MATMHADEVLTDVPLVRRLLSGQFPEWADLPIAPVASSGTDNALYRLGDELAVRLPRIHWAAGQVAKDFYWLPKLAPHLPLPISTPLAKGKAAEGYPYEWGIYHWLEGEVLTAERVPDQQAAAEALAEFVAALQGLNAAEGPLHGEHNFGRGEPLRNRDAATRQALADLEGVVYTEAAVAAATAVWETALAAPEWAAPPVWLHGDLLAGNVLFRRGKVSAVIDFGGLGVGDPACDLKIAWSLLSAEGRACFRARLQVDEATWQRGRGWALSQALIFIPYYLHTNPVGVRLARRTVAAVLRDDQTGSES